MEEEEFEGLLQNTNISKSQVKQQKMSDAHWSRMRRVLVWLCPGF